MIVVDDEPQLASVTRRALERRGYKVSSFHSSTEALDAFRERPDEFHLVVSDFTMPDMNGLEMIDAMRRTKPGFRAILMSGATDSTAAAIEGRSDLDGWLPKPFGSHQLLNSVASALSHGDRDEE